MKRYQSHKIVQAAKIDAVHFGPNASDPLRPKDSATLFFEDGTHANVAGQRFNEAQVGGYFVLYPDGYTSYSPAQAFEEGYTEVPEVLRQDEKENTMNDQQIEKEIQAKGKTAPRVTPADIEANITHCYYINAADAHRAKWPDPAAADELHPSLELLTFCVLVLRNGFTVTGESACASPENFDAEIGRNIARQNAVQKIWPLMGYQLRDELHRRAVFDAEPKVGNMPR